MLAILVLALVQVSAGSPARPVPKPVARLDVTVTDPAGKPVEGALVMALSTERLYRLDGEVDPDRVRSAPTGRDGRARIDAPPPAPWTVVAHARGFVTEVRRRVAAGPIAVRLEKGQAISGTVRDGESGRPVAGARVSVPAVIEPPRGGWEEEALRNAVVTDAQGRFRLEGIGRSRLRVTARAPGYAAADRPNVRPGEAVELFLFPGASLGGVVRDEARRPVKDAVVRLEPNGFAPAVPPEKTDANGEFTFAGVVAGDYAVIATEGTRAPALAVVTVDAGASASVSLTLTAGSYVVGRVVDGAGRALPGRVRLDAYDGRPIPAVAEEHHGERRDRWAAAFGPVPRARSACASPPPATSSGPPRPRSRLGPTVDLGDADARRRPRDPRPRARRRGTRRWSHRASDPVGRRGGPPEVEVDAKGAFVVSPAADADGAEATGFAWGQAVADAGGTPVTIVLVTAGAVTGRVVDAAGAAVDDARIEVESPDASGSRRFESTRSSEGDGAFTLRDLAPGAYALVARASGRGEASMSGVRVRAGATTSLGTITLPAGGVVRGSVVDSEGRGIPGATVSVDREGARRRRLNEAQTDSTGAFEVTGVPAGVMRVVANHPSYAEGPPITTEVDPEKEPVPVRVVLLRGGTIEGRVTRRDGRPFTAGRVALVTPQKRMSGQTPAAIAGDGSFRIEHVPPGRVEVTVMAFTPGDPVVFGGGEDVLSSVASRDVEVREEETVRVDLALRDVVVAGRVTRGRQPAAGVAIGFMDARGGTGMTGDGLRPPAPDSGPPPMNAVSREDGAYELVIFTPGRHSVVAAIGAQTLPGRDVDVPDAERFEYDFEIGSATVSGVVVDADGGAPVPGASLFAQRQEPDEWSATAEAGPDGRFSLSIEPGDYRLRVRAKDRQPVDMPLSVGAAGVSDLRIDMQRGLTISGRVLDAAGRPVPGLAIAALDAPAAYGIRATVLGDGSFLIAGLAEKPYRLVCGSAALGYAVRDGVKAGGDPVTLRLRPGGRIAVRVVDTAGQPVVGATAFLARLDGFATQAISEGPRPTDDAGMASLSSPEGLVTVRVAGNGGDAAMETVAVRAGETAALTITLVGTETKRP
ncbi:MAG: carboxypeptidase-like regulatory domain-containing protein [Vicinamibacteria bacterium]